MWSHWDTRITLICTVAVIFAELAIAREWDLPVVASVLRWITIAAVITLTVNVLTARRRVLRYQKRRNDRADKIRDQVLADDRPSEPYFVYLRPFDIDGAFVQAPRSGADETYVEKYGIPTASHDLETAVALLVHGRGDLIAVTDDTGEEREAGAGHIKAPTEFWRRHVSALTREAAGVFVVPFDFEGTAWEIDHLTECELLDRTLLIMPALGPVHRLLRIPLFSRNYREHWEAGRKRYVGLELPGYDDSGAILEIRGGRASVLARFGRAPIQLAERAPPDSEATEVIRERLDALARSYCDKRSAVREPQGNPPESAALNQP